MDDSVADFLSAVSGRWEGRAVHTPVGPFPYDIDFARDAEGCAAGVARPGSFHHRWQFCPAGDGLELEFLSDFGGNDQPLYLQLHGTDNDTFMFHSRTHAFLKVGARFEGECLRLQVLHDDRLHVEIHLRRPASGTVACPWSVPAAPAPEGPGGT